LLCNEEQLKENNFIASIVNERRNIMEWVMGRKRWVGLGIGVFVGIWILGFG